MIELKDRIFRMTIPVAPSDSDHTGFVRPSAVQGYVITAATRHLTAVGASADELLRRANAFWVLIRLKTDMLEPIPCRGEVEVVTWGADPQAAGYQREAEIYFEGRCAARVSSIWCLTDASTRKILRPSVLDGVIELQTCGAPRFEAPKRIRQPARTSEPFLHTVRYTDLDLNGHLHSARYTDVCCNALGLENRNVFVCGSQINYHAECRAGEVISVYSEETAGEALICGIGADGKLRFEACLKLGEINY